MAITFIIIGFLLLTLFIGKIAILLNFKKQVTALYANAKDVSDTLFSFDMLKDLPDPVQRYFRYSIKDGQPYISFIRLKHEGLFKTNPKKKYINITGEQYFSIQKPQFIWKGTTMMFTALDSYIANKGSLKVLLLDNFNVVNGKGSAFNEGELQRWLAESVWFPTNLLPSKNVKWTEIDKNSAKLSFSYKDISFYYIVLFNALGEITQMETLRFMTKKKRERWICTMSDYRKVNEVKIPFSAEVTWKLEAGDYNYAKFKVTKIEYNIPEKF